nr:disks large-associated protein 5-like isoform X1 [Procambarus clarkii]XP_045581864.1 disks large-associated protein 5-like isoform X1 [Procambarus clarkii]XP_045581865.1 disks large-associated protein 5-like isoform X1 [Procambarus clarkii]
MGVECEQNLDRFRGLLKQETLTLSDYCLKWKNILKSTTDIPEAIEGDVMVAVGQAELLMKERFSQFNGLIDDCEFKRGEKEIKYLDLQGFWDIIYFEVEDVVKKFGGLEKTKSNGWKEIRCSPQTNLAPKKKIAPCKALPVKPKTGGASTTTTTNSSSSSIRAHILAARKRMLALKIENEEESIQESEGSDLNKGSSAIENGNKFTNGCNTSDDETKNKNQPQNPETAVFDAGFFKVETPTKTNTVEKRFTPGKPDQKVLASTVLRERMHDSPLVHKDYSPCIRVTRSMKAKSVRSRKLNL